MLSTTRLIRVEGDSGSWCFNGLQQNEMWLGLHICRTVFPAAYHVHSPELNAVKLQACGALKSITGQ